MTSHAPGGDPPRTDAELLDLAAQALAEGRNLQLGAEVTHDEAERINRLTSEAAEREIAEHLNG